MKVLSFNLSKISAEIEEKRKNLEEEKKKLYSRLYDLEKAELKNKALLERAKQIMEGNRGIYIQKVNQLIEKSNLPRDAESIPQFCNLFDSFKQLLVFQLCFF